MIPFKKVDLGQAYQKVEPLFKNGFVGLGEVVFELEKKLAEYLGCKYVVSTNSCTSALFLALQYERLNNGVKNVFIPSMTVPLVYNAAAEAGMYVAFDMRTDWVGNYYQISGSSVFDSAHEISRDQFSEMKAKYKLKDMKVCFSFYPTKTIGSADGGAIATDDEDFANWARQQTTYGRTQEQFRQSSWNYDVVSLGHKMHYTNLQAAICIEQLDRLDQTLGRLLEIVRKYNEAFNLSNNSCYLYRINVKNRDYFLEYMQKHGIECGVHFKPLHLMQPFKDVLMYGKEEVEEAYKTTVSLPLYSLLTDEEIGYIITTVKEYAGRSI